MLDSGSNNTHYTYYLPIKCTSSHGNLSCFVCISVLDGGCSHAMVCLVKSSSYYTKFQLSETEQIFLWEEGSNIDCNFHADVRIFTGQNNIRPK